MSDAVSATWQRIEAVEQRTLDQLFAGDDGRVARLSHRIEWGEGETAGGIRFDWSKTHLDDDLLAAFEALAEARDFAGHRNALLTGEKVNVTEGRAAEHSMRGCNC